MFIVGVDLGQTTDYTAVAILERTDVPARAAGRRPEHSYQLRHLHRPALGTKYPAIVEAVLGLLGRPPLTRSCPLIVDKTGVGAAVADMFTAAAPVIVTARGRTPAAVNSENPYDLKVPKRELVSTLVALFQTQRLKVAEGLELAPTLVNELVNFKVKVSLDTGHDSYEAWRQSVHDDLVLSVALACWFGEHGNPGPYAWLRNNPAWSTRRCTPA